MDFRAADWPAPQNISAGSTTRLKGASLPPFQANNLGLHVGDQEALVLENRQYLKKQLQLPAEPVWLNQTHSNICIIAEQEEDRNADAAISRSLVHPLVILTADCVPIVLCDKEGKEIAGIHAGWKGLYNGIIENTLKQMRSEKAALLAWIGPAICQSCYEVNEELYQKFTQKYPESVLSFKPRQEKYLFDLAKLAEIILNRNGVSAVFQSGLCTFELKNEFYSYRRTPQTGRIGTLIWFNSR